MFLEKIKPMISEKFGIDEAQITADTRIIEDLGADSLDLVDMLTIIEDDFNIVIPDEAAMNMRTVGDVVDYMQKATEK
ncbi:MAG: acyl carrier protein [Clostridiales bacterium]|nr:acyl carrier protein [Clostridiales bacterium]